MEKRGSRIDREAVVRTLSAARLVVLVLGLAPVVAWAAHAYAQFGDIRYPPGFGHFAYVNPQAPKGGAISLVAPTIASSFDKFNPFTLKGTEPPGLSSLTFDTLLTGNLDEPSTAYGLLAEDVAVAADGRSVVFRLNPKARFHNGDPVLAADVKHTFEQLTSPAAAPQYVAYFADVSAAVVLDERRIRFDFRQPNAELPLIVGGLPVFSRKWSLGPDGRARALDQIVTDHPISSGPYRIGRVNFGKDITYERDPAYWARNLGVRQGQYNFDRVTYQMYADNTASFEGFKAGEFDLIQAFIAKDWARQYKGGKFDSGELVKKELKHQNPTGFQGFIFNTRLPRLADPRVRQAIGLAMDYEWMNRQLFYGAYSRLRGYFTNSAYEAKGLPGADEWAVLEPLRAKLPAAVFTQPVPMPPSTTPPGSLRDNLRQARGLLAEAGWTYRDGALRNAAGEAFTLEFLDNSGGLGRVIQPVIQALGKLGIAATFRVTDYALYEKRMKSFDFQVTTRRTLGRLNPGAEQFQAFHSSLAKKEGASNIGGVSDPAVDALIDRLMAARTRAELTVAARALDRVLRHGFYAVPHWYSAVHRVAWRAGRFGMPASPPPFYQPEEWALGTWWSTAGAR